MSLTYKTSSGFFIVLFEQIFKRGFQGIVTVILSYFLAPEDFGLMAMIAVFTALGNQLMESGFTQALIRKTSISKADSNTAFYSNIFLGVISYLILFFAAPFIADFYNQERLIELIRFVSFSIIFNSVRGIQIAIVSREMKFKILFKINIYAAFLSGCTAVILAFFNYGVWALVIQILLSSFFLTYFLWIQKIWRPSFIFSSYSFQDLYKFSYKIFLAGLIGIIFSNLYFVVISKIFSLTAAGLYYFADKLRQVLAKAFISSISSVTYPALSKKKNNIKEFKNAVKKIIKTSTFALFPIFLFLAALSNNIFNILLDEKWYQSIYLFQLMLLGIMLQIIKLINFNILKITNRPDLLLRLEIFERLLMILILFFSINYGIVGILIGDIILSIIVLFMHTFFSKSLINYSTLEQIIDFLPQLFLASAIAVVVHFLIFWLEWNMLLETLVIGLFSIIFYILLAWVFKLDALNFIQRALSKKLFISKGITKTL